jgi:hypothetical protein
VLLTHEERNKFAAWLEERAREDRQLVVAVRGLGGAIMEQMARQQEARALAFEHVAKYLRSVEDQTISAAPADTAKEGS